MHSQNEDGFSKVFAERIAPRLNDLEKRRQALLTTARKHAAIAVGAGAVLGLLFLFLGSGAEGIGSVMVGFGIPLTFGAVAAFLPWKRQADKWTGSAAEAVIPASASAWVT